MVKAVKLFGSKLKNIFVIQQQKKMISGLISIFLINKKKQINTKGVDFLLKINYLNFGSISQKIFHFYAKITN